jgi:hypothetical protein
VQKTATEGQPHGKRTSPTPYLLGSPPRLPLATTAGTCPPQASKILRDSSGEMEYGRPLPSLPETGSDSRKSSGESHAPSITPSLLPLLDCDTLDTEDVEFGVAKTVVLPSEPSPGLPPRSTVRGPSLAHVDRTSSDYEQSPPSSPDIAGSLNRHRAETYLPATGSNLEEMMSRFSPLRDGESETTNTLGVTAKGTFSLTEAEWMRRTPSPEHHKGTKENKAEGGM